MKRLKYLLFVMSENFCKYFWNYLFSELLNDQCGGDGKVHETVTVPQIADQSAPKHCDNIEKVGESSVSHLEKAGKVFQVESSGKTSTELLNKIDQIAVPDPDDTRSDLASKFTQQDSPGVIVTEDHSNVVVLPGNVDHSAVPDNGNKETKVMTSSNKSDTGQDPLTEMRSTYVEYTGNEQKPNGSLVEFSDDVKKIQKHQGTDVNLKSLGGHCIDPKSGNDGCVRASHKDPSPMEIDEEFDALSAHRHVNSCHVKIKAERAMELSGTAVASSTESQKTLASVFNSNVSSNNCESKENVAERACNAEPSEFTECGVSSTETVPKSRPKMMSPPTEDLIRVLPTDIIVDAALLPGEQISIRLMEEQHTFMKYLSDQYTTVTRRNSLTLNENCCELQKETNLTENFDHHNESPASVCPKFSDSGTELVRDNAFSSNSGSCQEEFEETDSVDNETGWTVVSKKTQIRLEKLKQKEREYKADPTVSKHRILQLKNDIFKAVKSLGKRMRRTKEVNVSKEERNTTNGIELKGDGKTKNNSKFTSSLVVSLQPKKSSSSPSKAIAAEDQSQSNKSKKVINKKTAAINMSHPGKMESGTASKTTNTPTGVHGKALTVTERGILVTEASNDIIQNNQSSHETQLIAKNRNVQETDSIVKQVDADKGSSVDEKDAHDQVNNYYHYIYTYIKKNSY